MSAAVAFNELRRAQSLVKLGDIAEFIMGQAPPGSASNFEGRGTVFVKAGEFGQSHPVVREWTTKPLRYAKSGDVLICVVGATAGKLNLGIDCAIGRSVAAIRPRDKIFDRFLYFQLLPKVLGLRASSTGSAQGVINKSMLANIELFVPEIAEQHRIVAEIEKQFTRLDAGVAALRRVQANLKRYRAAVLKAACEGRLVPTEAELAKAEGRTYETGEQLLARILTDRRKDWQGRGKYKEPIDPDPTNLPPLPDGWEYTTIDLLLDATSVGMKTGPFGSLLKKSEHTDSGVPVVGIENIGANGRFVYGSKIHVTSQKAQDLVAYELLAGDVIISRSGTVGELCVVPGGVGIARFSTNIMLVRLASPCKAEFFCFLFAGSPFVLGQVQELCKGSTRVFLNQHILRSIVFPLPPRAEQARIVAEVERRLSVIEKLEATVAADLLCATRLRQSILQRAFAKKSAKGVSLR